MKIAIIPARGGSQRLPGKNIKPLAGKPLISWTIEAAIKSQVFDYVFVSTDCKEIAAVSQQAGALVPFLRPAELATATATTASVVEHLVSWFDQEYSTQINCLAILQPTTPLRNAGHIQDAIQLIQTSKAETVISICELEFPIQFCNTLPSNHSLNNFINPKHLKRTQDLESYYRLNGAIYLYTKQGLKSINNPYTENSQAYIMPAKNSIDIDTLDDFLLAEYYLNLMKD